MANETRRPEDSVSIVNELKGLSPDGATFTATLLQNPEFKQAVTQMQESHKSTQFYTYEAILILFLWVVRAWRLQKASTWLIRIWTQAWIAVSFWILALLAVPAFVWGDQYRTFLSILTKAIVRTCFSP